MFIINISLLLADKTNGLYVVLHYRYYAIVVYEQDRKEIHKGEKIM